MDGVWGQEFSRENRTLDVHVRTLRTKLGAAGHYIETFAHPGWATRWRGLMTRENFPQLLLVGLAVMILCTGLFVAVMASQYEEEVYQQLRERSWPM